MIDARRMILIALKKPADWAFAFGKATQVYHSNISHC